MFEDSIDSSWSERGRRGWMTLTSFGLQALITGVLFLLPLLRPTGLPSFPQLSTPISLGQPLSEVRIARSHGSTTVPPQIANSGNYLPGAARGDRSGLPNLFNYGTRPVFAAASPPTPVSHRLRLSRIREGDLIRKTQPAYPAIARSARIQGIVVVQAIISKQGTIENLKVLAGHAMLVPAAIDAVRQWRYRPYVLNNEPVEVETQITVNFSLAGN
jgi:protein TonB